MSDENMQETIRANGEVVFGALKTLNSPSTIQNVVDYLAEVNELKPSRIKRPVQEILTTGYNLGFLRKKRGKYILETQDVSRERSKTRRSRSRAMRTRSRSRR